MFKKKKKTTLYRSLFVVLIDVKEELDFEWLYDLGEVFCVFDKQDSGNICFSVKINNQKDSFKYAGARIVDYLGNPQDASLRLKQAIPVYQNLELPSTIKLENHFATKEGYLAIFDWVDGECLHSHWAFTPHEKLNHPNSQVRILS